MTAALYPSAGRRTAAAYGDIRLLLFGGEPHVRINRGDTHVARPPNDDPEFQAVVHGITLSYIQSGVFRTKTGATMGTGACVSCPAGPNAVRGLLVYGHGTDGPCPSVR